MNEKYMWAWWSNLSKSYLYVYPYKIAVEACIKGYFPEAIKNGEGRIVQVKVSEVENA